MLLGKSTVVRSKKRHFFRKAVLFVSINYKNGTVFFTFSVTKIMKFILATKGTVCTLGLNCAFGPTTSPGVVNGLLIQSIKNALYFRFLTN